MKEIILTDTECIILPKKDFYNNATWEWFLYRFSIPKPDQAETKEIILDVCAINYE